MSVGKRISIKSKYPTSALKKSRERQKDISSNQKQEKQKQLLERIKNKKSNGDESNKYKESVNTEDLKYKNLYRETKKELKVVEKQLQSKNEDMVKLKADVASRDQEIENLKKKLYDLSEINNEVKTDRDLVKKEKEDGEKQLHDQIQNLQIKLEEVNSILENREYLGRRFENIKKANKGFFKRINKLKQQNAKKDAKIRKLKKELDSLDLKLYEQRKIIENYSDMKPDFLLHTLIESMSISNFHEFSLTHDLHRKLRRLERTQRVLKKSSKQVGKNSEIELYGYLRKRSDKFMFVELNGKEYGVESMPEYRVEAYTNGIPATALLTNENTVAITYFYRNFLKEFKIEAEISQNTKDKEKEGKKDKDQFEPIGDFRVLIVSSRNGVKYRDRLKLHGLKADTVDGFELKARTLALMDKADVVILCVDSMAHVFSDYAKQQNDPKYQYIYRDNEEKVVSRVIYAKHMLGL